MAKKSGPDRYSAIIDSVFSEHFIPGCKEFEFTREEFGFNEVSRGGHKM